MDPFPVLILIFLCLTSGFFSLASAALHLTRKPRLRLHLRPQAPAGEKRHIPEKAETSETVDFSMRIWNLLARFAGGAAGLYFFPSVPAIAALALAFVVFAEALPRFIASVNPEGIFFFLFPVLSVLALPWKPLYRLASVYPAKSDMGEAEFLEALEEGEKTGAVESRERSMVEGVLHLGDRPVSAFMTHRSEIEWLDIDAGIEEVREKIRAFRSQGFFPVIRGTQDNIAGIVSVEGILTALAENGTAGGWRGLAAIMKKPRFIPETLSALKAFEAFKEEDEYNLCVMDEYGGFAGSLSIRDLVEEIVGEMGNAPEEAPVILREDGTWLADGSISLDELAETPGLEALAEEQGRDYHTLAGFILKLAGEIPQTGAYFDWEDFRFTVLDLDGNRIDKVLIERHK
ncbi:MAG: hemolysin family protein [Spirochaetaceae bacterium]|jgi:putative hemolysin|nr:hemolysin family protein [Spirochaetaceae bacterium]